MGKRVRQQLNPEETSVHLPEPRELIAQMEDTRARTLTLIQDLDAQQLMGPRLPTVNPLRWEIGHAAYFHEYWVLREHLGEAPGRPDVDRLYDSVNIHHDTRWDLPLPPLEETLAYMDGVRERVRHHLEQDAPDPRRDYLAQYAVFHEDMHTEAFTYTRQTLAYPPPAIGTAADPGWRAGGLDGDAEIPGGTFLLGAMQDGGSSSTTKSGRTRSRSRRSASPGPRSATPSSRTSSRTAATGARSSGTKRAGPGAAPPVWSTRRTGGAGPTAGSGGTSTAGNRCPPTRR